MVIARFNRAHRARIFDVSPAKILARRMCGHLNPAKGCFRLASYPGENLRSPANGLTGYDWVINKKRNCLTVDKQRDLIYVNESLRLMKILRIKEQ